MAITNINFNNNTYQISESALSPAASALRNHLSTTMNGSGATIKLDGASYDVDSAKLSAVTNDFVSHLRTIAGNGSSVVINGVEYGIDSAKVAGAISSLETAFGNLASGGGSTPDVPTEERLEGDGAEYYTLAPTALSFRSTAPLNELQEIQINGVTVDPSNYTLEEGSTIVTFPIDYLKTLDVGSYEVAVASDSKTVKGGFTVAAPELNEHGFYYNQPYANYLEYFSSMVFLVFRENNMLDIYVWGENAVETCSYTISGNNLTINSESMGTLNCSIFSDGTEIYNAELGATLLLSDGPVCADEDYLYVVVGLECIVSPLNRTKSMYNPIRTGVNGSEYVTLKELAFYENTNIVSAPIMPNTLRYIENSCFANCVNLTSVILPDVKHTFEIGGYAFSNTGIVEIVLPSSFKDKIHTYAFYNCKNLCSVTIGMYYNSIGEGAFCNCTNLTNIIYEGTTAQWNTISKGTNWNLNVPATYVQCSDGQVAL